MNPFHGLPPSLLLLPAFAMILIIMAWGKPKRKAEKADVLPFTKPHRTALLSEQEAELNRERSWFGHSHRKAG